MGIEYYLIDRDRQEVFELGKWGWWDTKVLKETGPAFDLAVLSQWCGWALLTPKEYGECLGEETGFGPDPQAREREINKRYTFHEDAGVWVRKDDGAGFYDFEKDRAYAKRIADRLRAFLEERDVDRIELVNDAEGVPWFEENGWVLVGSRYEPPGVIPRSLCCPPAGNPLGPW